MKKSIVASAVLFALTAATGAFAKDMNATVKSVDKAADTVTMDNGQTLKLPEGIEAETLKPGEKVHVSFKTDTAGKTTVQAIKAVK